MGYTFRTSGPWGPGLSEDLSPAQVDQNFWQAIQDIAAKAAQGVGISNFVVSGADMTVVLTDHTLLGPYPLPISTLRFRGEWLANTSYLVNDIITHVGSTYVVTINHTSAATFDPGANDGLGNDYYGLLLQNPDLTIPSGGVPGMVLTKATTADYVMAWQAVTLAGLSDVLASPAPSDGDLVYFNGASFAYLTQQELLATGTFVGLADVNVATPVSGEPIIFDGAHYKNTRVVDLPWAGSSSASGTLQTIDRANGEVQLFEQSQPSGCTIRFAGWPPSGQFARLVLQVITDAGAGLITWPATVKWPGGSPPVNSQPGTDIYVFASYDGGATIYGNTVGQNYS